MKFQIFLSFVVSLFAFEFNSAVGAESCLSYLGPNSRILNIDSNPLYYVRVLDPAFTLPIVTIHERNGKQVYDDQSFEAFVRSQPEGHHPSNRNIDLGEGLTLQSITHPQENTTRFLIKKSFRVPLDGSDVEIIYELDQDSVQIGSRSNVTSVQYKLVEPREIFPTGRYSHIAPETYVGGVFKKEGILSADITVRWSLINDTSSNRYTQEAVFRFAANGTLDRTEFSASESGIEVWEGAYCEHWELCANLLFRTVFGKELNRMRGLSPNFLREISLSARLRESLNIVKLLSFSPKRETLEEGHKTFLAETPPE